MSDDIIALCKAYLEDELRPKARMKVEQRMAMGDRALIEAMEQLKGFRNPETKVRSEAAIPSAPPEGYTAPEPMEEVGNEKKPLERPQVISPFDVVEAKANTRWLAVTASVLGGIGLFLVVYLIYLQWDHYLLKREKGLVEQRAYAQAEQVKKVQEELRKEKLQLNRVKALMMGELPELSVFKSEVDEVQSASLFWDKSTYRAALMFREAKFTPKQAVQLWSYNVKERDWFLVGNLSPVKSDSLYIQFTNDHLGRSSGLELRFTTSKVENPTRNEGKLIARISGIR